MTKRLQAMLPLLLLATLTPPSGHAGDGGPWARVLERHVRPGSKNGVPLSLVDYPALARGDAELRAYLVELERTDPAALSPAQRKALWINAYNALAVKMVVDHWPLDSIKDAGGLLFGRVWDKAAGQVGGEVYTLNQIEHEILRPLGDPRIHMAIVCASVSCPDLRREPFVAERLDEQLDEQVRQFLANSAKGMRADGETLWLSAIFDWFEEDFTAAGGVVPFVRRYAPASAALPERARRRHLDYDWGVNGP